MFQPTRTASFIGLGYIGLPTAAVAARSGIPVIGVDTNAGVVALLNDGKIHIVEPDLDAVVHDVVANGRLRATTVPEPADIFVITVPTPLTIDRKPAMDCVQAAAASIAPVLKAGDLVILESTSPIGSTRRLSKQLAGLRTDLTFPHPGDESADIAVAYCPERVLPGQILRELVANDRIIGGLNATSSQQAQAFYKRFVEGECLVTSAETAEMVKLTENSYRDVSIAFANEVSMIAHRFGINPWELITLANHHPRVNILQPGAGVGGHCIAVDPWFIVDSAPSEAKLIRSAREVNDYKVDWVIQRIIEATEGIEIPTIAVLGLAFKPNIDDLRESPALHIATDLARRGIARILAVEPNIERAPLDFGDLEIELVDIDTALVRANVVAGLVAHNSFKSIPNHLLASKRIVDACGLWR